MNSQENQIIYGQSNKQKESEEMGPYIYGLIGPPEHAKTGK